MCQGAGYRAWRWTAAVALCAAALALVAAQALAAAGSLDTSFSGDGKRLQFFNGGSGGNDFGFGLALQRDGRIVVAGSSETGGATGDDMAIARYKADGSLDHSFSGDGKRLQSFNNGSRDDEAFGVAVQRDGRIVVVGFSGQGQTTASDFAIARYNPNGSLDTSFSGDGKRVQSFNNGKRYDSAFAVAVKGDGKIVVAGDSNQGAATGHEFAIARFNPNGSLDTGFSGDGKRLQSFGTGSGDDIANAVAVQGDGRIVVIGVSDQGASGDDMAIARFKPSGSLDTSFSGDGKRLQYFNGGSGGNDFGFGLALQRDGRIVVAGSSETGGASGTDVAIARYRHDGLLDTSFSGDGKRLQSFDNLNRVDQAAAVAIQRNGGIVAAGNSDTGGTTGYDMAIARFHPSGSLDTGFSGDGKRVQSFNNGSGYDASTAVAIEGDGRIVVAGQSDQGSPTARDFAIARFLG